MQSQTNPWLQPYAARMGTQTLLDRRSTTLAVGLTAAGAQMVVVGSTASWLRGDRAQAPRDLDVAVLPEQLPALVGALGALGVDAREPALRRGDVARVPTPWCPLDVFVVTAAPPARRRVVDGQQVLVADD